ncbi:hypothetical protein DFH09DRAFT_1292765 [Mycena vulgaris]|nr:hypothetical protein DFH09DRAFT_1292765 [Mycena vulgaris]
MLRDIGFMPGVGVAWIRRPSTVIVNATGRAGCAHGAGRSTRRASRSRRSMRRGRNLPEEGLRCLSEWISVLEARATVPGASLGAILGGIQSFEMSLTTLEHILTTPLPFVYSVHIRVVWLYLFLLPLQLVSDFQWHTVPAFHISSGSVEFISTDWFPSGRSLYLGFVAAGEEIEQPFATLDALRAPPHLCRQMLIHTQAMTTTTSTSTCSAATSFGRTSNASKRHPASTRGSRPKPSVLGPASSSSSTSAQNQNQSAATAINTNGNGNTGGDASLLSPELNVPYAHTEAGSTQIAHAYGGNIYRTSLASLSDTVSLEDVTEEDEEEEITETETETEAEGEEGTEEMWSERGSWLMCGRADDMRCRDDSQIGIVLINNILIGEHNLMVVDITAGYITDIFGAFLLSNMCFNNC